MRFTETLGISHRLKIIENELRQNLEDALFDLGLTLPQYAALSFLEEKSTATNAELARKSFVTPQTMNKIMVNLEKNGFVTKAPNVEHGLKQDYAMKPKAKRILCKAHVRVNKIELKMVEGISKADLVYFYGVLDKCLQNLLKRP